MIFIQNALFVMFNSSVNGEGLRLGEVLEGSPSAYTHSVENGRIHDMFRCSAMAAYPNDALQ